MRVSVVSTKKLLVGAWLMFTTRSNAIDVDDADCKNDKTSMIKIDLVDSSPFHLRGSFPGPEDTPYEGGHFEVVSYFDGGTQLYKR